MPEYNGNETIEYDEDDSVPVILENLPGKIHGFTCFGSDYEPIIILNARLPYEMQRETYFHEKEHIRKGELWDPDYHEYGE